MTDEQITTSLVHRALNEDGSIRDLAAYAQLLTAAEDAAAEIDIRAWAAEVVADPAAHGATPAEARLIAQLAEYAEDPCSSGCSDPARHAEGGHDV